MTTTLNNYQIQQERLPAANHFQSVSGPAMTLIEASIQFHVAESLVETALKIIAKFFPTVAENLRLEHRLGENEWSPVVEALVKCSHLGDSANTTAVEDILVNSFKLRTLRGQSIKISPVTLGRIVEYGSLVSLFRIGKQLTVSQAQARLNRLRYSRYQKGEWENVPLGRFHMWSTFDSKDLSGDPFGGCSPTTACCRLGLPFNTHTDPCDVAMLRYQPPSTLDLVFPTVADAYAGGIPVSDYFLISAETSLHGCTKPRSECAADNGMPECVHAVLDGANLLTVDGVTFSA